MSKYYIEHQKIFVSVDCIIFGFEDNQLKILIGRRQMDPGCGEWSLSGGFVRHDESVSDAAYRVLNQLTGINQLFMRQVTEPISFRLLPKLFTLTQLQKLYEAVNGEEVDKRNFRKRIKDMDFIEKTQLIDKSSSKRGAALYRFNTKAYNEEQKFKL